MKYIMWLNLSEILKLTFDSLRKPLKCQKISSFIKIHNLWYYKISTATICYINIAKFIFKGIYNN